MAGESKLRAAVIGVGVGWNHIEGYQTHPCCELAAICDINEALLNERGDRFNVPPARRFTDYRRVLASPEIDAVSIALPNWLHEPVAVEAFQHGKHVLIEKPLALSVEAGERILAAAKSANRVLMVCYNHRYRPEIVWLKQLALKGEFGHIYAAKAGWLREGWIPTHGAWFTQRDRA
ncbi:MAG: Gfo/Idh/MocA family oxidoreductase, partial [Thermoflexales bacterium]|nr:Gfo/Idh/MocA family oxidoreductase [Thermoflexales bacterium]